MPEYRTPGVYIEEISVGTRPVQASSTTETGFVGVLTLPPQFMMGSGKASGLLLPAPDEDPALAWNRAVAFRGLLPAPAAEPEAPAKRNLSTTLRQFLFKFRVVPPRSTRFAPAG